MKFNFKLPSMVNKRDDFNLSHSHVLTHNFGQMNVISAIDIKPGDDLVIDLSAFTRLMPLPCPTYGGVKVTHRAYAVNFDFIIHHFSEFLKLQKIPSILNNGTYIVSHASKSPLNIPTINMQDIQIALIMSEDNDDSFCEPCQSTDRYDIYWATAPDRIGKYHRYTSRGRRVVSWLSQLGYKLKSDVENYTFDCLALFAFWKFYLEWVVPARFVHMNSDFLLIKKIIDDLDCQDVAYSLIYHDDDADYQSNEISIKPFLHFPTSFLDDDPYTTSFVSPYGSDDFSDFDYSTSYVQGLEQNAGGQPINNPIVQQTASLNTNGVPGFFANNSDGYKINQLSLLSLGRLQKLVNAHKVTSTKVLDWLRTEYGITPSSDSLRLSKYLGSFESQILVGDVMATATTDSQLGITVVGQYAGKGLGGSSAKWRFKSDFTGMIFVTAEISTKSSYVNGVSPLRSRTKALQFFHNEFDNVGVRAIKVEEIKFNTFDPTQGTLGSGQIFGFSPRYSEYKFKNDEVTGDFMFPSVNSGLDSWYLSRKFKYDEVPKIGLEFLSASSDSVGSQYDRIFQNTNNVDHFYSVYKIDIHETSFMESMFDYFKTISESEDKRDVDVALN